MFKVIYVEKRKPELTFEAFVRRWRIHGGFAMQDPVFWDPISRYIQNDCLVDSANFDKSDGSYDGVGEIFYPSQGDCELSYATSRFSDIVADGDAFFAHTDRIYLKAEVHELLNVRPGAFKVFVFIKRPRDVARHDFFPLYEATQFRILARKSDIAALGRQIAFSVSVTPTDDFEAVLDFTFDTLHDAQRGLADWHSAMSEDDESSLFARAPTTTIAARSCVLYDKSYYE